jgi:hypothetical protein
MLNNKLILLTFFTAAISAIANVIIQTIHIPELGDGKLIAMIFSNRDVFPAAKYLAGMETLRLIYAAIWQFPPVSELLPSDISNPSGFIRITGIIVMACTSMYLVKIYPGRYSLLLPITTPIWLLFSFGYLEYYPFIAGVYLALLCWLFNGKLEEKSAMSIGMIAGGLPLIYIGFAPVSFIIIIIYLWKERITVIARTLGVAFFSFVISLSVFWSKNLSDYFIALYQDMNFGETNTIYEGYRGMSASSTSIFFSNEYAWSLQHLEEIFNMLFYGIGLAPIVFFISLYAHKREIDIFTKKTILATVILGWNLFYLIYTIPKLGPILDIDMFFMVYITIAFFSGAILDKNKKIRHNIIIPLHILSTSASTVFLFRLAGS